MNEKALEHAKANQDSYLEQLFELLRIPSVSTTPEHKADIERAAQWIADDLKRIGIKNAKTMPTNGNPVVYGEWLEAGEGAPTVLVYGHYDVQPVDPLELWDTAPFEPEIRDGKIYARGASDDKGQLFIHAKAVESILSATGTLPINMKFIFEGEEEVGSLNIEEFVLANADLLAADSVVISDSRILSPEQPSVVYGLRGLTYMEVKVKGPERDLHSGSYGGTVHNPAQLIAEIAAAMHAEDGKILIPGFYDKVRSLSDEERSAFAAIPYGVEHWQQETGLKIPWGEAEFTLLERIGARPTCEVNGIYGGFMEEGQKTVLPAEAGVKISMRLVADQDPDEIADLFTAYVKQFIPEDFECEIIKHSAGWPAITPIDSFEMQAAASAYETVWGKGPVFMREGGSIPIVAIFQKELNASAVLMGFGLDDNIHSPNESFRVDHFTKGIDAIIHYYYNLAG